MNYLLDTCVISEFKACQPNQRVVEWLKRLDERSAYLSVITIGEIRKGIEKLSEGARKQALSAWFEQELLVRFADRIIDIDLDVTLIWGDLIARLQIKGRVLPALDSLIAATALAQDLIVVTRNEADFANTGVKLYNPWDAPDTQ